MLKEAMQYFLHKADVKVLEVEGREYSTEPLHPVREPRIEGFETSTLTSIIDYITQNPDKLDVETIIHIKSPTEVVLKTERHGKFEQRETLIIAEALIPELDFGKWMSAEQFIIELQAKFAEFVMENEDGSLVVTFGDRAALLKCVGNVRSDVVRTHGDDGISQKVEVKQGITMVGEAIVPNPVTLAPFRTFPEIDQVESEFIFRMREGRDGIEMALFEADGGAWQQETIQRIKNYFIKKLEGENVSGVVILA